MYCLKRYLVFCTCFNIHFYFTKVVEIVDSSSGEESSSSSSDSDDCIMLSDSEVPPSPEADEDPNNSGTSCK